MFTHDIALCKVADLKVRLQKAIRQRFSAARLWAPVTKRPGQHQPRVVGVRVPVLGNWLSYSHHGEMKSDPKTGKGLSLWFQFCPLVQMKKTVLRMKEQAQTCSQAWASAEVTKSDSCSNGFQCEDYMNVLHIPQRTGQDCHAFDRGFFQAFWSLLAWPNTEMLGIPQDYTSVPSWVWAATQCFPARELYAKSCPGL